MASFITISCILIFVFLNSFPKSSASSVPALSDVVSGSEVVTVVEEDCGIDGTICFMHHQQNFERGPATVSGVVLNDNRGQLYQCIEDGGGHVHHLELNQALDGVIYSHRSPAASGRTVATVEADDCVLARIPSSHILTLSNAIESDIGRALSRAGVQHLVESDIILGGFLLTHANNASRIIWSKYLEIMPATFRGIHPLFARPDVLEALDGSMMVSILRREKAKFETAAKKATAVLSEHEQTRRLGIGYDQVLWAMLVARTRALNVSLHHNRTDIAIVPMLSEIKPCSSQFESMVDASFAADGMLEIRALAGADLRPQQELFRNYGQDKASDLYLKYGFVPDSNAGNDEIEVRFDRLTDSAHNAEVVGSWSRSFWLKKDLANEQGRNCLSFVRLYVANQEDLDRSNAINRDPNKIGILSGDNERKMWKTLEIAVKRALKRFETTLGQDRNLLIEREEAGMDDYQMKMAIRMRMSEKRVGIALLKEIRRLYSQIPSAIAPEEYDVMPAEEVSDGVADGGRGETTIDAFERLRRRVVQGGGRVDRLEMRRYDGDNNERRGIHATSDIRAGETIIEVPLSYLMTSDMSLHTPVADEARANRKPFPRLTDDSLIAAMLLLEKDKGERGRWFDYIDLLPSSMSSMPLFWSKEEIRELRGTTFATNVQLEEIRADLDKQFDALVKAAPRAMLKFTKNDFVTAMQNFLTRGFEHVIESDNRRIKMIVPMVDMIDHAETPNVDWHLLPDEGVFRVYTIRPILAGEAVYGSYVHGSNAHLLLQYGFATEHNANDIAQLWFNIHTNAGRKERRGFQLRGSLIALSDDDDLFKCFAYLRKAFDNDERRVLLEIQASAKANLKRFATTIAQDEQLLKNDSLAFRTRMAVLVRVGEKRVCEFWIRATTTMIDVMKGRIRENDVPSDIAVYFK